MTGTARLVICVFLTTWWLGSQRSGAPRGVDFLQRRAHSCLPCYAIQACRRTYLVGEPTGNKPLDFGLFSELLIQIRVSLTGTVKIQKDSREIGLTRMGEVPRIRQHLGV